MILGTSTSIQYKTVIVWPGWDVFTNVTTGGLSGEISPAISMREARDRPTLICSACRTSSDERIPCAQLEYRSIEQYDVGELFIDIFCPPSNLHFSQRQMYTDSKVNAASRLCDLMLRLRAAQ